MTVTWNRSTRDLWTKVAVAIGLVASLAGSSISALAAAGQPVAGQLGLQDGVTPVMDNIRWFHNSWVNPMIIVIAVFVAILMLVVAVRFN